MKRIGKLTMKVYDENTELSSIGECCYTVSDNEDLGKELARLKELKASDDCENCRGCPEYYREP